MGEALARPLQLLRPALPGAEHPAQGQSQLSLLGLTQKQAARLHVSGAVRHVPSVDNAIARCSSLDGTRRASCYAALDRQLTAEIVPVIPFLWRNAVTFLGPQVAKWEFDHSTGMTAFAHVAVKRSHEPTRTPGLG